MKTDGFARYYLAQSLGLGIGGNQKALVEENKTPLCVIQGAAEVGINNDFISHINYGNLFGGNVFIIKETGHAVFWENPAAFNSILSVFLTNVANAEL